MHDKESETYKVGNCRPPLEHRFKPGQSGNPAGKKPGARNLRALFLKAAFAKPRPRHADDPSASHATQLEAMFARLLDRAAHGDGRATARVLELCEVFLDTDAPPDATEDATPGPLDAREIG